MPHPRVTLSPLLAAMAVPGTCWRGGWSKLWAVTPLCPSVKDPTSFPACWVLSSPSSFQSLDLTVCTWGYNLGGD